MPAEQQPGFIDPPRLPFLCGAIVKLADRRGRVSRSALRELYAAEFAGSQAPEWRDPVEHSDRLASRHRVDTRNYWRGREWHGLHADRGSSNGAKSSQRLSKDLVRLERLGATVRDGDDLIVVVDWSPISQIIRGRNDSHD